MNYLTASLKARSIKIKSLKKIFLKHFKLIAAVLILLSPVFMFAVLRVTAENSNAQAVPNLQANKTYDINKEFIFPLRDSSSIEVGKIKYTIENAQLMDEIIIKGQRATAIEGKTFLIINLKLTNELDQPIKINTRDYIRLIIDKNEQDLIAPDIHNDPVEIQPISTKLTRVGVPLDENFKTIQLKIGEINGEKTTLDINF